MPPIRQPWWLPLPPPPPKHHLLEGHQPLTGLLLPLHPSPDILCSQPAAESLLCANTQMPTSFSVETGLLTLAYKTPPDKSLPALRDLKAYLSPQLFHQSHQDHVQAPHVPPRGTRTTCRPHTPRLGASALTAWFACSWLCRVSAAARIPSSLQCAGCSLGWLPLCSTRSRVHGLSSCSPSSRAQAQHRGAQASLLCGTWDLPGPEGKRVSPALADGSLTTGAPAGCSA